MAKTPENPYRATSRPQNVVRPSGSGEGDATGGLIPYKNPKALIAYYLGIGSLLIFPLGFVSIVLGFMGLADRKRNPVIKGSAHAWIGIVLGGLSILCGIGLILTIFAGIASRNG
ncbi:MAG: hypothetical protein GY818_17645 [Planctomycetaceae bacterium]|nr:hypothetical protein [Planctomycetaceae bacterium]